jgi:hypothetical protein
LIGRQQGTGQGRHVHDDAVAGLQVGPGGPGEVEDEVDLILLRGSPLLVGEVLQPVEVRPGGEVVQHVDPAELAYRQLDDLRAVGRVAEATRLQRHDLATGGAYSLKRLFRGLDRHVAAHQRSLSCERHGGLVSHASAGASDDADLS